MIKAECQHRARSVLVLGDVAVYDSLPKVSVEADIFRQATGSTVAKTLYVSQVSILSFLQEAARLAVLLGRQQQEVNSPFVDQGPLCLPVVPMFVSQLKFPVVPCSWS